MTITQSAMTTTASICAARMTKSHLVAAIPAEEVAHHPTKNPPAQEVCDRINAMSAMIRSRTPQRTKFVYAKFPMSVTPSRFRGRRDRTQNLDPQP